MFLHVCSNNEHPLELVHPKILCTTLRGIKQVSSHFLCLQLDLVREHQETKGEFLFFSASVFADPESKCRYLIISLPK